MAIIENLLLSDDNVAFHPNLGNSYQLNSVAKEIIELLQIDKTKMEIVKHLSKDYDISLEELYIDVSDFISKLKFYGLI
ncbi:PqqD family protein [Francisella salina]|uniref:Coenzyme PQQ synthesis protein D (PqqD) n=1 Tax=Francisella salina TaxID=573569 RepID=A0ABM5M9K1_FRAST|nr:PqqD family protein [Francisella salina]AEI35888.1 hypothetical protein F7308_0961 [Francisella salina]